tara:strand:+ start:15 stop:182 length:168 start_codon:yes stop_codon:yes gene_type:complete
VVLPRPRSTNNFFEKHTKKVGVATILMGEEMFYRFLRWIERIFKIKKVDYLKGKK